MVRGGAGGLAEVCGTGGGGGCDGTGGGAGTVVVVVVVAAAVVVVVLNEVSGTRGGCTAGGEAQPTSTAPPQHSPATSHNRDTATVHLALFSPDDDRKQHPKPPSAG
ncbi:hypothetical protein GCM10010452_59490 [Crossiella cryophila]